MDRTDHRPEDVLSFWFPDSGHETSYETHSQFWEQRMQGGMDAAIRMRFADLTRAAAMGELDHWADHPRGRLALILALDQFPRSLWRGTPGAYGQDIKATRLALDGIENGDFDGLAAWEQMFYMIAIVHCEGPDHLQRMDRVTAITESILARFSRPLAPLGDGFRARHARVRGIIARFGRHPHRNAILGRLSTAEEAAYIATGDFPHLRKPAQEASDA